MTLPQIIGYGLLTLAIWKLVRRRATLNLAGPEKDHWLKGLPFSSMRFQRYLKIAADYGKAVKIHGLFGQELFYVSDPRALHHILVKEQHIFEENNVFILCNKLIFGEGLISTLGEQHRKQRKMINPVFSTSNMRQLLSIIHSISQQLKSVLMANLSADSSAELDVLPWLSRSALDCVCEGVLGYHSNALDAGNGNEYTEALRMIGFVNFPYLTKTVVFRPLMPVVTRNLSLYWRKFVDCLTMSWLPTQTLRNFRELRRIVEVMDSASRTIFEEKKLALEKPSLTPSQSNGTFGGTREQDIMSIMIKSNASSSEADRLSDAELLGQMNVMIFAGFETTTAAVARALHMLAMHPHVQEQLRAEICDAIAAYGATDVDHSYANAVVRETLRLYPSIPILGRTTTEAVSVPLQFPVRSTSGEEISAVPLVKNQTIVVSVLAANHNQAVWGEDASEWKPERWLNSSQGTTPGVKDGVKYPGVYSSMMTFLAGSRSCIGFKFAEMEINLSARGRVGDSSTRHPFRSSVRTGRGGNVKEVQWKMGIFFAPVVKQPAGDGETPQLPLSMRLVRE
ncbi:cytochrome P450 [Rhizopogon vinicolor AM-OR11-026]|uniref:Cytochrome P450 n=1 Tax=Rhizopogon vinicolor AM-OR11-026 TaxID=1314800 RepID=A0A1B7MQ53_9AGAM|nr:cytochrome P450 [Rhizopogon vinicolor AM-OR11-026]